MMNAKPRAAIFDLDGTLVDSLPGIAAALNAALQELSLPTFSVEKVRSFIGNGSWQLAHHATPSEAENVLADEVEKAFKRHYALLWQKGTEAYAGATDLLNTLSATGVPIAILSNKPHDFTTEIVAALFPDIDFTAVVGHGPEFPKKPDPASALDLAQKWKLAPKEIAYVGDSDVDLATAQNAKMQPLIVAWGYNTPMAELAAQGLTPIETMAELVARF